MTAKQYVPLVVASAALLALSSCAGASAPSASPTPAPTVTVTTTAAPDASAAGAAAPVLGDCGTGGTSVPAIYHAWSQSTAPIEVTVSVFHKDQSVSSSTITAAGPAVTVVSWDCRGETTTPWTITASTTEKDASIYCSIESYVGVVDTQSHFGETGGASKVSCSGSPGGR